MYQKPDFIKVSVKVEDVFSNYTTTGCPYNEGGVWMFTVPCPADDPNGYVQNTTYIALDWGHQCYTTYNP